MIGIVLAAGEGRRLRPLTERLPKTLLAIDGESSILDLVLANLRAAGLERVLVVIGHAAEQIERRVPGLQQRLGLAIDLVVNDRASEWNNAYSLWLARHAFADGALLVNGDTVHPPTVEQQLLARRGPSLLLAVDDRKQLAQEEMKVLLDDDGRVRRISKVMDPSLADGEYIGVSLIEPAAAAPLADALEATWQRDPSLYYEDGYQQYAEWGGTVATSAIGPVEWVEVDDHDDLRRAGEVACRY